MQPDGIAYDSSKGEVFVSNGGNNSVSVISDATNSVVATIDLGNDSENNGLGMYPVNLAFDSARGEIFVVNQGATTTVGSFDASAGAVSVISDATNTVVATVPLGDFPSAIAYDPAKGEMFVTNDGRNPSDTSASNTASGLVSVISDATNTVVATVSVTPFPGGVAYDPAKAEMFVSSSGSTSISGGVSVISDATNAVVATVSVSDAGTIAYDPAKGELFVVTPKSNSTSIISDATNAVVATKPAGPGPFEIAYDSAKGELFVTNPIADTVTILSDSTSPSSTSSGSSSFFSLWYLAIIVLVLILLALVVERRRRKSKTPPPRLT
jgi:YVTN family beta-propeller protein